MDILIGSIIANFIVALFSTFNKEKQMVKDGGEPLPTSSYLFLVARYLIWGLVTWGVIALFNITTFTILISIGLLMLTYFISIPIEVLMRLVVVIVVTKSRTRKINKELKNTED